MDDFGISFQFFRGGSAGVPPPNGGRSMGCARRVVTVEKLK